MKRLRRKTQSLKLRRAARLRKRLKADAASSAAAVAAAQPAATPKEEEARFLSRMNRETVMEGSGLSLEARLSQRKHYHDRTLRHTE